MCSRFRSKLLLAAVLPLVAGGCDREERSDRMRMIGESVPTSAQQLRRDAAYFESYERNAYQIAEGHRLYFWMNCVGCHASGGGGMGPPLMDAEWRYGGEIDQIAATIVEGRPNGMPSFRGKLTAQQVWQLAAYVRSLSGQTRKDAVPGRTHDVSSIPPPSLTVDQPHVPDSRTRH